MAYDMPCVSHLALYLFSMHVIGGNPHTSSHWKLDIEEGKIVEAETEQNDEKTVDEDGKDTDDEHDIINLLWDRPTDFEYNTWEIKTTTKDKKHRINLDIDSKKSNIKVQNRIVSKDEENINEQILRHESNDDRDTDNESTLFCGASVNETKYDHLRGIIDRRLHPRTPEPDVATMFNIGSKSGDVDMSALEKRLKKLLKSKPNSASTFAKIGNFWRIKGNTQKSIECFRKVLYMSPNNAEVLLNLARVLFNVNYLDDAISLTKRSLELQTATMNSWLQHYTLGEILKAYGHFHEASVHFHHALTLNPGFQPACGHLRDLDGPPTVTTTHYTLFTAVVVVVVLVIGIFSSGEVIFEGVKETIKSPRHFNRGMAMRSLKHGNRLPRLRKIASK